MRISWDEYFIKIVKAAAERSTCPRGTVGALIVKNNNIVGTGYNGAPRDMAHCTEVGCAIGEDNHCHRAVHAEVNAIIQAGKEANNSTIYITHEPCINCCKAIIQAGVKKVIYINSYEDERLEAFNEFDSQKDFLKAGGVEVVQFRG